MYGKLSLNKYKDIWLYSGGSHSRRWRYTNILVFLGAGQGKPNKRENKLRFKWDAEINFADKTTGFWCKNIARS
jgi:hypothetical protein